VFIRVTNVFYKLKALKNRFHKFFNGHWEMGDFGSGQGRSDFETGGVGMATSRNSKSRERRHGAKDAIS
jgi:hypothetical protein